MNESKELVPVNQEQALAKSGPLPDWIGAKVGVSFSTLDLSTDDGIALLSRINLGADAQVGDCLNQEIDAVGFYMQPYDRLDEQTGETVALVYCCIVDAAGKTYGCSSLGIRRSLLQLAQLFGYQPWNPPLRVRIQAMKARVGKMYGLEYISRGYPVNRPEAGTNHKPPKSK